MKNKEMLEEKIQDEVNLEENDRSEEDRLIEELADSLIYELEEENAAEQTDNAAEIQDAEKEERVEQDAPEVKEDVEEEKDISDTDADAENVEESSDSNSSVNRLKEYVSSKYEEGEVEDKEKLLREIDLLEKSFRDGEELDSALDIIRKGINYERDMAVAIREGEIAGRNMKIEMELRRMLEKRVPYVAGGKVELREGKENNSIFDLARGAR